MNRSGWICVGLVALNALVFGAVRSHAFVTWDDPQYVYANPHVMQGLTADAVAWAFTTGHMGNWHPLTWLSHLLDVSLFGMNSGPHHLTSLVLHAANTLLVFDVLRRMTDATWRSAFVAALFAVHPLHVESVAWLAERKDVLSTLFGLCAMEAYVAHVRRPRPLTMIATCVCLAASLMSKPMLVTLPFLFLLLDHWPLRRTGAVPTKRLVLEKAPLFLVVALASVVALAMQRGGGAVGDFESFPMADRGSNALVSYVAYLVKTFVPTGLAALYPYPKTFPVWRTLAAGVVLAVATLYALREAHRRPWLVVGWLWFLGTLLPVIGLVQIGTQSMADRYTYFPLIGLLIALAWDVPHLVAERPTAKAALPWAAGGVVVVCAALAWNQVRTWQDSESLWRQALDATQDNAVAHNNLGAFLNDQERYDEALVEFEAALVADPRYADPHNNIGVVLKRRGKLEEAANAFRAGLPVPEAHDNLGLCLEEMGRFDEALEQFAEAVRLRPYFAAAHDHLGRAYSVKGRDAEAEAEYREALRLVPDFAEAHQNLGIFLGVHGRTDEAVRELTEAVRLNPDNAVWRCNLGFLLKQKGDLIGAAREFQTALTLDPELEVAQAGLQDLQRGGGK